MNNYGDAFAMSITITYPFKIYSRDDAGKSQICQMMNQVAFAEAEKTSSIVKVTPVDGRPVSIMDLARVASLASAFSSSYIGGLGSMVDEALKEETKAQKQNGRPGLIKKGP